ncbi:Receptor-like protein 12, partial [Cucurbita argyrosperma subsp. sororia]
MEQILLDFWVASACVHHGQGRKLDSRLIFERGIVRGMVWVAIKLLDMLLRLIFEVNSRIPNWLGKLKNLKYLDLENSYVYGPIPTSLGNLSTVEYLYLLNNALRREILVSLGRLLNLRELDLGGNRLEEVSEECFIRLRNLEVVDISNNLLKGVLADTHFANLSRLNTLLIDYNEHLSLDMKSNRALPFQLKFLDASSCTRCFGSELPRWLQTQNALVNLQTWLRGRNLIALDLSHNQIVGPFPTRIDNQMPKLEDLFLSTNLINDSLPLSLCKLKNLTYVDLSNNGLSGIVRGCLLTSKLHLLDLSLNQFSETFPHSHGNDLSNVEQLNLRSNNFEGSMPIVLKNSKILVFIDLEGNKFSGNIPIWVGDNLGSLQFLRLGDNLSTQFQQFQYIPREGHLSTFNEASSFDGNPYLCENPLHVKCVNEDAFEPPFGTENQDEEDDKWEKRLLYIMIILGYVVGFWGVVGVLILKKSWRYTYFKFTDEIIHKEVVQESYDRRTFNRGYQNFGGSSQYMNDFYPRFEHLQMNPTYIRHDEDDEDDNKDDNKVDKKDDNKVDKKDDKSVSKGLSIELMSKLPSHEHKGSSSKCHFSAFQGSSAYCENSDQGRRSQAYLDLVVKNL